MGEPVVIFIESYLLFVGSIGLHAPYLHSAGGVGIVINILAVRAVFRTVHMPAGVGSKRRFCATVNGYFIEIIRLAAIALTNKHNFFSIGVPAMPVRRCAVC